MKSEWRSEPILRQQHKEDGLFDPLLMTLGDIAFAVRALDALMGLGADCDGYLITSIN